MKFRDMALAQNTTDFPRGENEKRGAGDTRERKTNDAEGRRPGEKIFDEPGQPEPESERNEAARGRPKESAPGP
jgi:hypothetical protein